jgi:hypothetical protein
MNTYEMRISRLIGILQQVQNEHGDLRVITPGFDEGGLEDLGEPRVTFCVRDLGFGPDTATTVGVEPGTEGAEKCLKVNFS